LLQTYYWGTTTVPEALRAGVCVPASDIPENREAVSGAGFTFRQGDVDLERVLQDIISDVPAERKRAKMDKKEFATITCSDHAPTKIED
jgi:hypothetical protein